jgi:hypothetical protein
VDAASASPQLVGVTYYGIEATHSRMCKFDSENAPGYRTVSTAIREWVADAPDVIPIRWEVEEDQRRVRANLENFERLRQYVSSQSVRSPEERRIDLDSSRVLPLFLTDTHKQLVGCYRQLVRGGTTRGPSGTSVACGRGRLRVAPQGNDGRLNPFPKGAC